MRHRSSSSKRLPSDVRDYVLGLLRLCKIKDAAAFFSWTCKALTTFVQHGADFGFIDYMLRYTAKYSAISVLMSAGTSPRATVTERFRLLNDLRHSREMTLLCSAKVTQHNAQEGADLPAGRERMIAVRKHRCERGLSSVIVRTFRRSMISATDQCAAATAGAGLLPR